MKSVIGWLLAVLALTLTATAQRTTGTLLHTDLGAFYGSTGHNYQLVIQVEVTSDPIPGKSAWLYVSTADSDTGRFLFASGPVPPSVIKIVGNSIIIKADDLSQFAGPDFNFQNSGYPDLSMNCTMTRTPDWEDKSTDIYTERVPQPDGTVQMSTETGKGIRSSMAVTGTVIGYVMPFPHEDEWEAIMYQGRYRNHFVP